MHMLRVLENSTGFLKEQFVKFCNALNDNDIHNFASIINDEDRFAFVYKNPVIRSNQISKSFDDKNLDVAKQLKLDGNKAFQANDYLSALYKYFRALLKCPQDNEESTKEFSIILANRSAVFYHIGEHQHALEDIQTSLESGYPAALSYKIYDRKARCLLALKQHKSAVEAFRKTLTSLDDAKLPLERRQKWQNDVQIMLAMLSKSALLIDEPLKIAESKIPKITGEQNKEHPAVTDSITFKKTVHFGRFAEAKRNINAGDIIVVEKPHCSTLLADKAKTHCFQCLNRLVSAFPCPTCCNVAFCSKKCQKLAISSHHKFECCILPTIWTSGASITCHMALRIISQKKLDYFNKIKDSLKQENIQIEKKNFNYADYRSVYYLERNEDKRKPEDFLQRAFIAVFLFKCIKAAGYFEVSERDHRNDTTKTQLLSDDEIYVGGLLLRNLQFLQFNAHEVSELEIKNNNIDNHLAVFLGAAIYPTLSLFNHSCNPSMVRYFQGDVVIGQAIRTTYSGEMVAENYGPIFTQERKLERQEKLKSHYWFSCNCIACNEDWPLFKEMDSTIMRFRCETNNCNRVIIVPVDTMKFIALCPNCNQHMNLLKGLKALQDTDSMFRVARAFMVEGDMKKAINKFVELLRMLEETLAPPFKDFHVCQQATRLCMLALGNKHNEKSTE